MCSSRETPGVRICFTCEPIGTIPLGTIYIKLCWNTVSFEARSIFPVKACKEETNGHDTKFVQNTRINFNRRFTRVRRCRRTWTLNTLPAVLFHRAPRGLLAGSNFHNVIRPWNVPANGGPRGIKRCILTEPFGLLNYHKRFFFFF